MEALLNEISACTICSKSLPHSPRPVVEADSNSKIAIIGQAPGRIVHETGIPWNDRSGDNLRSWLGVTKDEFYSTRNFALIPMGFCFPGTGKSGDLPPRRECAPEWHSRLFEHMTSLELVILVGKYAQEYYLNAADKQNLTQRVYNFNEYLPNHFVLPHPSPRNNIWQAKNPWFSAEVLPALKTLTNEILRS